MQVYMIEIVDGTSVGLEWNDKPGFSFPGEEDFDHVTCSPWLKEYLKWELEEVDKRHGGVSFANGLFCPTKDILKNGWPFHVFLHNVFRQKLKLVEGGIPTFGPKVPDGAIP